MKKSKFTETQPIFAFKQPQTHVEAAILFQNNSINKLCNLKFGKLFELIKAPNSINILVSSRYSQVLTNKF